MQTANQPTVSSLTLVLCGQETVACIFVKKVPGCSHSAQQTILKWSNAWNCSLCFSPCTHLHSCLSIQSFPLLRPQTFLPSSLSLGKYFSVCPCSAQSWQEPVAGVGWVMLGVMVTHTATIFFYHREAGNSHRTAASHGISSLLIRGWCSWFVLRD